MLIVAIVLSKSIATLGKLLLFSFLAALVVCILDDEVRTLADALKFEVILISIIYSFCVAGIVQIVYRISSGRKLIASLFFAIFALFITILLAFSDPKYSGIGIIIGFTAGLFGVFFVIYISTFGFREKQDSSSELTS